MYSGLIGQKNNNSTVLFNEFGAVLGLENERFCVLGIFSPAPALIGLKWQGRYKY
jgi:hypothetical protein